uniref:Uncharacterized protein n=2 Tax=Arundo donax TaxID=35708 RepID=A0A0A9G5P4_ARUDO
MLYWWNSGRMVMFLSEVLLLLLNLCCQVADITITSFHHVACIGKWEFS